MNLHNLQIFIDIVRLGSFAALARQNNIDPSAVSRLVSALERDLGYRLFDRSTRRLSLTEAGQTTFDRIQNPLEEINQIRDAAREMVDTPTGNLRITASIAFSEIWLMLRLKGFQTQYPNIKLDLVLADHHVDLISENIDVAIRLGDTIEGTAIVSRLFSTRYKVVASPEYLHNSVELSKPAHLTNHKCISFPFDGYRSKWSFQKNKGKICEIGITPHITISNALSIRRAAIEGVGVALLSDWTIEKHIANGELIDLFPDHEVSAGNFETAAWILYPSKQYLPTKTRVFIDYIRSGLIDN